MMMAIFDFNSPHVTSVSTSIETDREGHMKRVLTVETDLCLNVLEPQHDKAAVDALLAELQSKMGPDTFDRGVLREAAR
jgi:hypothetical protein